LPPLRRSRRVLTNVSRLYRTRRPAFGTSSRVQAIPTHVGAGAAAIGHHLVGTQADTTHPTGPDHSRPFRSGGQTLLISHDHLTLGRGPAGPERGEQSHCHHNRPGNRSRQSGTLNNRKSLSHPGTDGNGDARREPTTGPPPDTVAEAAACRVDHDQTDKAANLADSSRSSGTATEPEPRRQPSIDGTGNSALTADRMIRRCIQEFGPCPPVPVRKVAYGDQRTLMEHPAMVLT
jgi:hypothetical protein